MASRERLIDFVPEIYRAIVPELFERPVAEERNATCDHCAMVAPENPLFSSDEYFNPVTKCCTYHPVLPNYQVGGLLRDQTPEGAEGRRRIEAKISRRIGVTPFGISPPAKEHVLYHHGKAGFGRANALRCPYLDQEQGRCTVWQHRDPVCTTWFCKHNGGQDGLRFWSQLRDYLLGTQWLLSAHALRELGLDIDGVRKELSPRLELDARDLDEAAPDDDAYATLWGDWVGREEKLYGEVYELVRGLDREAFDRLGGLQHRLELDRLEKRYREMREPTLPDPLVKNPGMRVTRSDDSYIMVSYIGTDPLRLRKRVYDLLEHFDGRRSTADVRTAILEQAGVWVSDSLLTKLCQHRILVDPGVPERRHLPTTRADGSGSF